MNEPRGNPAKEGIDALREDNRLRSITKPIRYIYECDDCGTETEEETHRCKKCHGSKILKVPQAQPKI